MNMLCYITIWPPILLLRKQVFRWSTLLIQIIHQKIKILLFNAENSEVDVDSSIVKHSSPIVQPPQYSIAIDRPRRAINPSNRFIEECNIASYALSVAEEIEGDAEPSN